MMRWLLLGAGFAGAYWYANRGKAAREVERTHVIDDNQRSQVRWSSTEYGAGSASLSSPPRPIASTAYSAGTASLPIEQQAIRDPDTVR